MRMMEQIQKRQETLFLILREKQLPWLECCIPLGFGVHLETESPVKQYLVVGSSGGVTQPVGASAMAQHVSPIITYHL